MSGCCSARPGAITCDARSENRWKPPFGSGSETTTAWLAAGASIAARPARSSSTASACCGATSALAPLGDAGSCLPSCFQCSLPGLTGPLPDPAAAAPAPSTSMAAATTASAIVEPCVPCAFRRGHGENVIGLPPLVTTLSALGPPHGARVFRRSFRAATVVSRSRPGRSIPPVAPRGERGDQPQDERRHHRQEAVDENCCHDACVVAPESDQRAGQSELDDPDPARGDRYRADDARQGPG